LRFVRLAEPLKSEFRHGWLSSGRRESVGEHTWQMALPAVVAYGDLLHSVGIERVQNDPGSRSRGAGSG
jgi:putative hydrolase of HD superfamily